MTIEERLEMARQYGRDEMAVALMAKFRRDFPSDEAVVLATIVQNVRRECTTPVPWAEPPPHPIRAGEWRRRPSERAFAVWVSLWVDGHQVAEVEVLEKASRREIEEALTLALASDEIEARIAGRAPKMEPFDVRLLRGLRVDVGYTTREIRRGMGGPDSSLIGEALARLLTMGLMKNEGDRWFRVTE